VPGVFNILVAMMDGALHKVTVMQLLGPSLDKVAHELRSLGDARLRRERVRRLGASVIDIVAGVHRRGLVVRDVKPHNFCSDTEHEDRLFMVDFAMIDFHSERVAWCGTPDFTSGRMLESEGEASMSYRDDLEGVLYVLLYVELGDLPWEALSFDGASRTNTWTPARLLAMACRRDSLLASLREDGLLPSWFDELLDYARRLPAGTVPDWPYVRLRFTDGEGPMVKGLRAMRARAAAAAPSGDP